MPPRPHTTTDCNRITPATPVAGVSVWLTLPGKPGIIKQSTERGVIPVLFLLYPPCSTCQKAKRWLDDHGIAYEARHIKEENPTRQELEAWYTRSNLPLKRFFNTSGLAYKSLGLKDKLPTMSEAEQLDLLAADGMLVKRPLVIGDEFVLVGFKPAEWEQTLLK